MSLVKIKKKWRDTDTLTYKDYKSLLPKGNEKHFKELTGRDPEPPKPKVVKEELKKEPVTKKEEKVIGDTKEEKGKLNNK